MDLLQRFITTDGKVYGWFALIVAISYFPLLNAPFLFDDSIFIVQNIHIHTLDVKKIFTGCLIDGSFTGNDCNFYRPNQALIHALIYRFWELNPTPYHAVSVIVHWLNGILIFSFLKRLNCSRLASIIATTLFLIHPMQTEAVAYISGLSDPLGLMFMLLGIVLFFQVLSVSGWKKWLYGGGTMVCYLLAMLTKESAVVMVALLPLIFYCRKMEWRKANKLPIFVFYAVMLIMAAGYLYSKFTVFNFTGNAGLTAEKNSYTQHLSIRMFTFINVLPEYLKIILFPFALFIERPYVAFDSLMTGTGITGLFMLTVLAIGAWKSANSTRYFLLGVVWFFIAIAPVSGIIPINAIYLEHWLYIPSVGLIIWIAAGIDAAQKWRNNKWGYVFLFLLGVFYTGRTIARNFQWADAILFYTNEIRHNPNTARIYNNLAMEYAERKMFTQAITNYQQAIKLYDVYPQTHYNLGNVFLAQNRIEEAVEQFYTAAYMSPGFAHSYQTLATIYRHLGREDKAIIFDEFLQRTVKGEKPVTQQEIEAVYKIK